MKTEDENAPTCTPYLPDAFVFDMGAEPCQAVGMKNEVEAKIVYAVIGSYDYEGDSLIAIYDSAEAAKAHADEIWNGEDRGYDQVRVESVKLNDRDALKLY